MKEEMLKALEKWDDCKAKEIIENFLWDWDGKSMDYINNLEAEDIARLENLNSDEAFIAADEIISNVQEFFEEWEK